MGKTTRKPLTQHGLGPRLRAALDDTWVQGQVSVLDAKIVGIPARVSCYPHEEDGSAEEVVDLFLPNRGAFQAVADVRSKTTAKRAASYCVLTDPG